MKKFTLLLIVLFAVQGTFKAQEEIFHKEYISISGYPDHRKAALCHLLSHGSLTLSLYYLFKDLYTKGSIQNLPSKSLLLMIAGFIGTEYYLKKMRKVEDEFFQQELKYKENLFQANLKLQENLPDDICYRNINISCPNTILILDSKADELRLVQMITIVFAPLYALFGLGTERAYQRYLQPHFPKLPKTSLKEYAQQLFKISNS